MFTKEIEIIFEQISEVADFLWKKGWAERNGGNLSINVTEYLRKSLVNLEEFPYFSTEKFYPELEGQIFWITSTGSRIRNLRKQLSKNSGIIRVSKPQGYHVLWHGKETSQFKPTSELASHLKIHQFLAQKSATKKVILHTHPDELIAVSHIENYLDENRLNRILWSMIPEVKVFIPRGIGIVKYELPGSEMLADATIEALREHPVVLWEKHGCLAIGEDVYEAFDSIDTLNKAAKIFLLCKNAGFVPVGLSKEQVDELEEVYVKN